MLHLRRCALRGRSTQGSSARTKGESRYGHLQDLTDTPAILSHSSITPEYTPAATSVDEEEDKPDMDKTEPAVQ